MEYAVNLMLKLFNARCSAEILELRQWLIQIFTYETATDPGDTVTEWVDAHGGWVSTWLLNSLRIESVKPIAKSYVICSILVDV